MRQFELHRTYRGKQITAFVLQMQEHIHVSLCGGDRPHIGAVGIVAPDGTCSVTEFPTHREGVVCERWACALSGSGFRPAVVEAGIHYDSLDRNGIHDVLALTDDLLKAVLDRLGGSNRSPGEQVS